MIDQRHIQTDTYTHTYAYFFYFIFLSFFFYMHTLILQKSDNSSSRDLYKEAYIHACKAIQLDTNARYSEAKNAYSIVIKVNKKKEKLMSSIKQNYYRTFQHCFHVYCLI